MKKSTTAIVTVIVVILVIIGIIWLGGKPSPAPVVPLGQATGSSTIPVAVSQTSKVSSQLSLYQNAELGFSLKYPSAWEEDQTDTGVTFVVPIDQSQVSTVAKLEIDVTVAPGTCSFPPVTTVESRGTVTIAGDTADTISISNSVQGRDYFNRLYSLQNGGVCYYFFFSSIALNPANDNMTGSTLTQAQNNNKAVINATDAAFTSMVQSFAFVSTPAGIPETQAAPATSASATK